MSVVLLSGGFDPLHVGHIEMIQKAAQYGKVYVAVNSDAWLMRKKGFVFMNLDERCTMVNAIKGVEFVFAFEDYDDTACEAIRKIQPNYFGNGGDRTQSNTPEHELCTEMHIPVLYGLGEKIQSSSELVDGQWVVRKWGSYKVLHRGPDYVSKILAFGAEPMGWQRHHYRTEQWTCISGHVRVDTDPMYGGSYFLMPGESVTIKPDEWHRAKAEPGTQVMEVWQGMILKEEDIERK